MTDERGQIVPLAAAVVAVAAVAALGLARLGTTVATEAAAQSAADAVALAAALEGEATARSVAAENDVAIVRYRDDGAEVEVTVARGDHRATARARSGDASIP